MRKSLFCLFLFVMTLPAFSDGEFTVDTQIEWNGDVVADAIRSVDLDQDTSNRILVDLLDRDTFSVGDAVRVCRSYCDQSKALQLYQGDCPAVCERFGKNLVPENNKNAVSADNGSDNTEGESDKKSAKGCPDGTYDIGFAQCVDPRIDGDEYSSRSNEGERDGDETLFGTLTQNGTWAVKFSYGTINGITSCNNISGNNADYTWSNESSNWLKPGDAPFTQGSTGPYCWCKMTSPSASGWVLVKIYDTESNCAGGCGFRCSGEYGFRGKPNSNFHGDVVAFRSGVFSSVGQ